MRCEASHTGLGDTTSAEQLNSVPSCVLAAFRTGDLQEGNLAIESPISEDFS